MLLRFVDQDALVCSDRVTYVGKDDLDKDGNQDVREVQNGDGRQTDKTEHPGTGNATWADVVKRSGWNSKDGKSVTL
jgi:hypothetical protein